MQTVQTISLKLKKKLRLKKPLENLTEKIFELRKVNQYCDVHKEANLVAYNSIKTLKLNRPQKFPKTDFSLRIWLLMVQSLGEKIASVTRYSNTGFSSDPDL